eukprot:419176-Ditylum_brightwellii.AAC.1
MKEELIKLRAILDQALEDGSNSTLYPFGGVAAVGQDDKASVPVVRYVPITVMSRIFSKALVPAGCSIEAKAHDWHVEKIIPSVTHCMNTGNHVLDSMYSGGVNGYGQPQDHERSDFNWEIYDPFLSVGKAD